MEYSTDKTFGPPTSGQFVVGDIFTDAGGTGYICVQAGLPGSWAQIKAPGLPRTAQGVGAAAAATVVATEYGDGVLHKTVLTCTALPITIADDEGVAQYGGAKVYDLPEGLIMTMGAVIDGAVTLGATGTITDTWAGGVALGTATATTGTTLTGTEADIMP